eukprot:364991-Chlamydomonas_euryale.AAC.19
MTWSCRSTSTRDECRAYILAGNWYLENALYPTRSIVLASRQASAAISATASIQLRPHLAVKPHQRLVRRRQALGEQPIRTLQQLHASLRTVARTKNEQDGPPVGSSGVWLRGEARSMRATPKNMLGGQLGRGGGGGMVERPECGAARLQRTLTLALPLAAASYMLANHVQQLERKG